MNKNRLFWTFIALGVAWTFQAAYAQDFDFDFGSDADTELADTQGVPDLGDWNAEAGTEAGMDPEPVEEPFFMDAPDPARATDDFVEDPDFRAVEFTDFGKAAGDAATLRLGDVTYRFRWCPPGTFSMGSYKSELGRNRNELQHEVELTRGFWMLETEATLPMFWQFVSETGYETDAQRDGVGGFGVEAASGHVLGPDPQFMWRSVGIRQTDRFPVTNVSWNDAQAFAQWLNGKVSTSSDVKRSRRLAALPTEAQWEYACRAGSNTMFAPGDAAEELVEFANLRDLRLSKKLHTLQGMEQVPWAVLREDRFLFTAPTGELLPNAWGIHDLHGNVWEWCSDFFGDYSTEKVQDPKGPDSGTLRVMRGGGWNTNFVYARSAARGFNVPSRRYVSLGFRVVLQSLDDPPEVVEEVTVDVFQEAEDDDPGIFGDEPENSVPTDVEEEEVGEDEPSPEDEFGFDLGEDEDEDEEAEEEEFDDDFAF